MLNKELSLNLYFLANYISFAIISLSINSHQKP